MNQFWEDKLASGYYDQITLDGIKNNRGLRACWHNYTNLKISKNIDNNSRHLDYACGSGTLIGNYLLSDSIGVDISQNQIDYARNKYSKGKFFNINEFDFSLYENYFDTISVAGLIEFVEFDDTIDLINRLSYILKPGGQLLITTPNFKLPMLFLVTIQNFFGKYSYRDTHINKLTTRKMKNLLKSTYFEEYEVSNYMNVAVFFSIFNLKSSTKLMKTIDYFFSQYFGFMIFAKLKK